MLVYTVADHGTDLDTGISGVAHNFSFVAGATLTFCLAGCDASTNPVCEASAPTGPGSINGETFGPPQPLFAAGTPVCVTNRFNIPGNAVRGTVNVQTGAYLSEVDGTPTPIVLDSVVFTTSAVQVCPECDGGTCDSGTNQGGNCTVDGTVRVRNPQQGIDKVYNLATECPPGGQQGARAGVVPINLPLTTGVSRLVGPTPCPFQVRDDVCAVFGEACTVDCTGEPDPKGGQNQWCCSDSVHTPCFPTAPESGEPEHAIVRTGVPVPPEPRWPDPRYPKTASEVKLGAVFCFENSNTLPLGEGQEPGAVILNGTQEWIQ